MILGLRTVAYHTPDLTAAKGWYTQVVGHGPYFDQPFYVGFNVGGFELGLVPDGTPGAGGSVAYWGVPACNYPQLATSSSAPSRMSASRVRPRQTTMLPGGGSFVRAR
jgi:hypothetical protein